MQQLEVSSDMRTLMGDGQATMANGASAHHLLYSLNFLRQQNRFCDVTIVIDASSSSGGSQHRFHAHACVLASFSTMMEMVLDPKPKQRTICLKSLDKDTMSLCLDYIYGCEINVSRANVEQLLRASELLQFQTLSAHCQQVLAELSSQEVKDEDQLQAAATVVTTDAVFVSDAFCLPPTGDEHDQSTSAAFMDADDVVDAVAPDAQAALAYIQPVEQQDLSVDANMFITDDHQAVVDSKSPAVVTDTSTADVTTNPTPNPADAIASSSELILTSNIATSTATVTADGTTTISSEDAQSSVSDIVKQIVKKGDNSIKCFKFILKDPSSSSGATAGGGDDAVATPISGDDGQHIEFTQVDAIKSEALW